MLVLGVDHEEGKVPADVCVVIDAGEGVGWAVGACVDESVDAEVVRQPFLFGVREVI